MLTNPSNLLSRISLYGLLNGTGTPNGAGEKSETNEVLSNLTVHDPPPYGGVDYR
jgi:hypothetical protein